MPKIRTSVRAHIFVRVIRAHAAVAPVSRLLKQSTSDLSGKIDEYLQSFEDLLQDFRDGSQLRTELATVRMLVNLDTITKTLDALGEFHAV